MMYFNPNFAGDGDEAAVERELQRHETAARTSPTADVLDRIISGRTKVNALGDLLPWHWQAARRAATPVAA